MSISAKQALDLANRVLESARSRADEIEVLVASEASALTRFANNHIHQNVSEDDTAVSVRAVIGKRIGVASSNRLDDASLAEVVDAAVASAKSAAEDAGFSGLPEASAPAFADRMPSDTISFGPKQRAEAVGEIVEASRSKGLTVAGTVRNASHTIAVANSRGIQAAMPFAGVSTSALSMGDTGSGWASFLGGDAADLDAASIGERAADLALRTANPGDLEPGEYPAVLGPEAVADIVSFLAYTGFSAKAVAEGRSFMADRAGEQVMSELVTIVDDAAAPESLGLTFDYEGVPKRRIVLIDQGRIGTPVTDSYWAARLGVENTGHALPAPNSFGPMPLDMQVSAGDATTEELIADVERGVYVTRFHYTNVEDPMTVRLTGMTRDGTFLIENGRLSRPLKNLRFTQSAIDALASVKGATRERAHMGSEENASYVPGLLVGAFRFTGQTT